MKLWTMPRIVVGQFRPNEYVAACKEAYTSLTRGKEYLIDIYSKSSAGYNPGGWPDGKYKADYEEALYEGDGVLLVSDAAATGWYSQGRTIAALKSGVSASDADGIVYTNTSFFTKFGNPRAVYILDTSTGKKAYVYTYSSYTNQFTPTENKIFNS